MAKYNFCNTNCHGSRRANNEKSSGNSVAICSKDLCVAGIIVSANGNGTIRAVAKSTCTRLRDYALTNCDKTTIDNGSFSTFANCNVFRRDNRVGIGGSVILNGLGKSSFRRAAATRVGCASSLATARGRSNLSQDGFFLRRNASVLTSIFASAVRYRLTSPTNACAGNFFGNNR